MKTINQPKPDTGKTTDHEVRAEAFFAGAHDVPIESMVTEISDAFKEISEHTQMEAQDEIKSLEGELEATKHLREDADDRWQMFNYETGGKKPPFSVPLMAVLFSLFAVAAEAWFLAPVLQGWNIVEPLPQFVVAAVFVFSLGVLMKAALTSYENLGKEPSGRNWFKTISLSALALILAVYLGIFRSYELEYDAKMNPELGGFLGQNLGVHIALSILATIALPLAATLALNFGFDKLRYWEQWRKSRKDSLALARHEEETDSKLEAENEKLSMRLAETEATREEWINAARHAHAEGQAIRARRQPLWEIAFLLAGGGVLITSLVMAIAYYFIDDSLSSVLQPDLGRFAIYLGVSIGLIGIFSYMMLKRWNSPTPKVV
ncbi:MAG: hypothetical protein IPI64_00055 [Chloracidobacterium sp.]|nr:hypothetical protein [Chloracidobacterium sp.]